MCSRGRSRVSRSHGSHGSEPGSAAGRSALVPGEVINKVPVVMEMSASAGLYGYLLAHTREHPVRHGSTRTRTHSYKEGHAMPGASTTHTHTRCHLALAQGQPQCA